MKKKWKHYWLTRDMSDYILWYGDKPQFREGLWRDKGGDFWTICDPIGMNLIDKDLPEGKQGIIKIEYRTVQP
jgi:hypothetical protein